jgi:hypothetical protein
MFIIDWFPRYQEQRTEQQRTKRIWFDTLLEKPALESRTFPKEYGERTCYRRRNLRFIRFTPRNIR